MGGQHKVGEGRDWPEKAEGECSGTGSEGGVETLRVSASLVSWGDTLR